MSEWPTYITKAFMAFYESGTEEEAIEEFASRWAHELRNEVVEELTPDLVGESRAELKVELMRGGRNKGMEGEKGRR